VAARRKKEEAVAARRNRPTLPPSASERELGDATLVAITDAYTVMRRAKTRDEFVVPHPQGSELAGLRHNDDGLLELGITRDRAERNRIAIDDAISGGMDTLEQRMAREDAAARARQREAAEEAAPPAQASALDDDVVAAPGPVTSHPAAGRAI